VVVGGLGLGHGQVNKMLPSFFLAFLRQLFSTRS